jgi:hypothetical protein
MKPSGRLQSAAMSHESLGFCSKCLATFPANVAACPVCAVALQRLNDAAGALSREFLLARGTCCDSGCRNCPYPDDAATQKTCPRCARAFDCRTTAGCWCGGVRLNVATLERLRQTYRDCLCPTCLVEIAEAVT